MLSQQHVPILYYYMLKLILFIYTETEHLYVAFVCTVFLKSNKKQCAQKSMITSKLMFVLRHYKTIIIIVIIIIINKLITN